MAYLRRFDAIRDFLKSFLAINGVFGGRWGVYPPSISTHLSTETDGGVTSLEIAALAAGVTVLVGQQILPAGM